jgi:hypothetical protein
MGEGQHNSYLSQTGIFGAQLNQPIPEADKLCGVDMLRITDIKEYSVCISLRGGYSEKGIRWFWK